jgi:hypothetical protein
MKNRKNVSTECIAYLYKKGIGTISIGAIVGLSKGGVKKRLLKAGVVLRPQFMKKELGERGACKNCGSPLNEGQYKYCSRSCAVSVNNLGRARNKVREKHKCFRCSLLTTNKKYCSNSCRYEGQKKTDEHKREVARLASRVNFRAYCARLIDAMPSGADPYIIRQIYANCPYGHDVDHIIPLTRGGKHHQDNLQYLTKTDNKKKGRKLPEECPDIMRRALPAVVGGDGNIKSGAHRFKMDVKSKSGDHRLITD